MRTILSWFREKPARILLVSLFVVVLDQGIKIWVKQSLGKSYFLEQTCMGMPRDIYVFGDWFKVTFAENPGAAFSLTFSDFIPGLSLSHSKIILGLFSFIAIFLIFYFLKRIWAYPNLLPLLLALILGGAFGNFIDRIFYGIFFCEINCSSGLSGDFDNYPCHLFFGRVVDMFYFDLWKGFLPNWIPFWGGKYISLWPVFNIADAAISIGILGIFFFNRRLLSLKTQPEKESDS